MIYNGIFLFIIIELHGNIQHQILNKIFINLSNKLKKIDLNLIVILCKEVITHHPNLKNKVKGYYITTAKTQLLQVCVIS